MLETNIRLVLPGDQLYLEARRLRVETSSSGPEIMQRISGKLTGQIKCACVPLAASTGGEILAATGEIVPATTVESDDWTVIITDTGQSVRLSFGKLQDRTNLAQLLQRALVLRLQRLPAGGTTMAFGSGSSRSLSQPAEMSLHIGATTSPR